MSNCLFALGPYINPMTNVLLTDLGLSIPLKFLFESFIDKWVSTSVDSTIYWHCTFETFHLPLLFELLPSSDPGHKKFWKRETGSMFSLQKCEGMNEWIKSMFSLSVYCTLMLMNFNSIRVFLFHYLKTVSRSLSPSRVIFLRAK